MSHSTLRMDRQSLFSELAGVFSPEQAEMLTRVIGAATTRMSEESVRREDFGELKKVVSDLAAAQRGTEAELQQLAQAQRRTEERVEELAQAQRRTEERVEELAQAQRRTEERVEELAQAQRRTEVSLEKLARQVGGLSDTVGGDIEDIAYIVLHDVLHREFGWEVGVLERTWQMWDGEPEEVNVFGQAQDPARSGMAIWVVGEAKHDLTLREVKRFVEQLERARRYLEGEIFPVCFCYRARPEVQEAVREAGIRLVFSYGKLV